MWWLAEEVIISSLPSQPSPMLTLLGQWLLAYIAYSVFTKSLVRIMERKPVSYGTFEAINFRNSTIFSLGLMMKNYATNGGLRTKTAIAWMIVASLYVLVFPR
jgi:hypothetical protein